MSLLGKTRDILLIERLWKSRKNSNANESQGSGCLVFFILLFLLGSIVYAFQWCHSKVSYWDKIYVKSKIRTYKYIDFKCKYPYDCETVTPNKDKQVIIDVPVYKKNSNITRMVQLALPLYEIHVNIMRKEKFTSKKVVVAYEQPEINNGHPFIKPTDVIFKDSKIFKNYIEMAKRKFVRKNAKDFKEWTYIKPKPNTK